MGASAGQTIQNALCFPVLSVIQAAQSGDAFGAISTGLCPMSIGGIAQGIKGLAEGDIAGGVGKLAGGLADPLAPGLASAGVGYAATEGVKELQGTADRLTTPPPEQTTESDPQIDPEVEKNQIENDASVLTALQDRATQRAAYKAARNRGLSGAESQLMAGQAENATRGNATSNTAALRNASASTQNDWLEKMGYAKGLGMQAGNLQKGAFLNNLASIFAGAGMGGQAGSSL